MGEGTFSIPAAAWKHCFDEPLDHARGPINNSIASLLKMLPMILRMQRHSRKNRSMGFDPINLTPPKSPGPYQGVPLGGIGSGSIGRGWRGDFRRWQLRPGVINDPPVDADQFSLFVQLENAPGEAQVLFPGQPQDQALSAWHWNMPAEEAEYHALFPRAWTTYDNPLPAVRLTCRQISPVIADNYQESSYPAAEFRWKIENSGDRTATVGLMFTFQNGMGVPNDQAGGHFNFPFTEGAPEKLAAPEGLAEPERLAEGVLLHHIHRQVKAGGLLESETERPIFEDPLTFAIAARSIGPGQVTRRTRFVTSGSGADLWQDFAADGRLDDTPDAESALPAAAGETIGAAVAVTVQVQPGETREVSFVLAWDMPRFRTGFGTPYLRHYTRFYGASSQAAAKIAYDALFHADDWEAQIEAWQNPILADPNLPDWYKLALFNELYYIVDGGTIWVHPESLDPAEMPPDPEVGHFGYLESHEYRMYNTYDVHFYASFALIQLWPRLELALQRDIAAATLVESPDQMVEMYNGKRSPRKLRGAVPHDVGWSEEDLWKKLNGYFLHNVNDWKDLNAKFVLQVYRDYLAAGDLSFVRDTWEAVQAAMQRLQRFDRDGDGLIENDGFPDQTYDMWSVKGPSAYTGGLWLASLSAAACLAELMQCPDLAYDYRRRFEQGKQAYESKLWNGRYYNYDSSNSRHHDSIMADQLAGQWYARACDLPPIVNPLYARATFTTIFDWNVQRFQEGRMGAVNGMRPNGQVDRSSMQSQEVWTGSTYALAAAMIQEGMREAGFKTAWGVYNTTYHQTGYWFQTPEAWDDHGNYRAITYMRPLAIWAMQWALDHNRS